MSTRRNSDIIKLQHRCTGSSARLTDSRRTRNITNTSLETTVLQNDEVKILWDFSKFTETETDHNKPDLILPEKEDLLNSRCYMPI